MRMGSAMLSRGFSRIFTTTGKQSLRFVKCETKPHTFGIDRGVTVLGRRCLTTARPLWKSAEPVQEDVADKEQEDVVDKEQDEYHSIITNTERGKGAGDKHEFQAETRKLLDIVARSLYSEKEVFIRELISNCSDALEKLRYMEMTGAESDDKGTPLEIHIQADDDKKTLTIQDTGIGMTKEELIDNLGTIAKSGSKQFLEQVQDAPAGSAVDKNIIGQFGVGFYSAFMVGEKLDVYTRSYIPDSAPLKWSSDGLGTYEITEAEGVQRGTKVVIHLKGDCYNYAKEETIKEIIKKYSNFVGVPIFVNGKKANMIQALWTMETREITADMHEDFYRFIANAYDKPRYSLHYKADAPINIRALFYVPDYKPTMFDMSRDTDMSVTLYSRKVMILARANHILPKWLRFLKGVVDSEDIPLNLSRELLQDSSLIRKIRQVLTNRVIKFFLEKARKDPASYLEFYESYGLFVREGIVTTPEQDQREEIARLLRFESSRLEPGEKSSLDDYTSRMTAGDRSVYYFSAPSRELAETSPYMEAMKKKDIEVLYCFEPYDELVLMNLGEFDKKTLRSIENEMAVEEDEKSESTTEGSLSKDEMADLLGWMQVVLGGKVTKTKVTYRLDTHPCVITVAEMGAARHFLRTSLAGRSEEERYRLLQPTLEVNPSHPIIVKLHKLKANDPDLARLLADQIFYNAMIAAGLVEDPRGMLTMLNTLLEKALAKH